MKKIKIGTIGNTLVGKTAICRNYLGEEFSTEQMLTVGMEKFVNELELTIKENKIKTHVCIYDTSGQERYETTVFNFIEKCDGVLLVYAINFKESFNDISKWVNKIRELQSDEHFPVVLIGNKIDLDNERVINKEDGEKVAKNYKFPFYETSAKTGENVKEAFQHLIDLIAEYKEDELLNNINKKCINLNIKQEEKEKQQIEYIIEKNCCGCKKKIPIYKDNNISYDSDLDIKKTLI